MQHIVTKFVIKVLAFAYFILTLKYELLFFSKYRKACSETINKIRLDDRSAKVARETPRPKRENPIASQRSLDDTESSLQPLSLIHI